MIVIHPAHHLGGRGQASGERLAPQRGRGGRVSQDGVQMRECRGAITKFQQGGSKIETGRQMRRIGGECHAVRRRCICELSLGIQRHAEVACSNPIPRDSCQSRPEQRFGLRRLARCQMGSGTG